MFTVLLTVEDCSHFRHPPLSRSNHQHQVTFTLFDVSTGQTTLNFEKNIGIFDILMLCPNLLIILIQMKVHNNFKCCMNLKNDFMTAI